MTYGSVCSGIEAATVAWHPLGWTPKWFSEIEPFPSAVLQHHYPTVPNRGDMTKYKEWNDEPGSIDLLVGGTPCQSFSVAGLRKGMADPRGNLALVYLGLANRLRPRWVVWENVPGVLSSAGGRDFGAFLGGLGELGYGWAYRILDAQHFGVPQRRRRVFVVGYLGDWRRAAAVLFERESLSGHPPPRKEAGQGTSTGARRGVAGGGGGKTYRYQNDIDGIVEDGIGGTLRSSSATTDERSVAAYIAPTPQDDSGRCQVDGVYVPDISVTLNARDYKGPLPEAGLSTVVAFTRTSPGVRRLTPMECERLQGFPDRYTLVPVRGKPASDGPRYKALGNSMAVPVMAWIGRRIQAVDKLP
jgi:DNA (cytosine-5)-methyltransferase 1